MGVLYYWDPVLLASLHYELSIKKSYPLFVNVPGSRKPMGPAQDLQKWEIKQRDRAATLRSQ